MNPIDRATAQHKRLSPVWKFIIEEDFKVKEPYYKLETDTHIIVVEREGSNDSASFDGYFISSKYNHANDYDLNLKENERIVQAIPKDSLQSVDYLYYDDPDETEDERIAYINKMDIQKNKPIKYQFDILSTSKKIKSIEYVKRQPFSYQHGVL